MAAAQTSDNPKLAESLISVQEELKDARDHIVQLQSLNKILVDTNKHLVSELTNNRTDCFFMFTKSTRILMTNKKVTEVMKSIESHDVIKSILSRDTLTAQQLQSSLEPLIRVWSSGRNFSHFLPNARQQQNVDHNRPIFSLVNIRPFLDDRMRTKAGLSSILWKWSLEMHTDAMSFSAFRVGTPHKSELHAYISFIASCFLYNLYRESRVHYPVSSPLCCDYSSDSYMPTMEVNPIDLSRGPEPVRRQEDVIDIRLQMSKNKRRKQSH